MGASSPIAVIVVVIATACGGGGAYIGERSAQPAPRDIDAADFLLLYSRDRLATLRPAEGTIEALEEAPSQASDQEARRVALRDLAVAHLLEAEGADERGARRHRRSSDQLASFAARGARNDELVTDMEFVALWNAWRADRPGTERLAERFARRHPRSGDLVFLSWLIRGEIAAARSRWDEAAEAFRFGLGQLEHPLYAFALLRTADVWSVSDRGDDAGQAYGEVAQLGCADAAAPEALRAAQAAAHALGEVVREAPDGRLLPERCIEAMSPEPE